MINARYVSGDRRSRRNTSGCSDRPRVADRRISNGEPRSGTRANWRGGRKSAGPMCIQQSVASGLTATARPTAGFNLGTDPSSQRRPTSRSAFFPHCVVRADQFKILQQRREEIVTTDGRAVADDDQLAAGSREGHVHTPRV